MRLKFRVLALCLFSFGLSVAAWAAIDPYGVVVGTPEEWSLEPAANQGQWPHYQIVVRTSPNQTYRCMINMDTRVQTQVRHKIVPLLWIGSTFNDVFFLANGFHVLNSANGALDFIRYAEVWEITNTTPWKSTQLVDTQPNPDEVPTFDALFVGAKRVYVFGEKFDNGGGDLGMHLIHQNQGNLCPSEYDNATWKDGAVIIEYDPITVHMPGLCYWFYPGGYVCGPGFDLVFPNRKMLMTRFSTQKDFTHNVTACGLNNASVGDGFNLANGQWEHWGPFNTEQIEVSLNATAGNPDLYIRKGAQANDTTYDVRSKNAGLGQEFGWMYGNGQYWVSVKANGANSAGSLVFKTK